MSTLARVVPPVLEGVVRRCLEKDPEERFQSARDVGFALDAASGATSSETVRVVNTISRPRRWLRVASYAAGLLAVGALGVLLWRATSERPVPRITQLTDRSGLVDAPRFTSDEQTIVYSALWSGHPPEIFTVRLDDPDLEPRSLGLPPARLMSVSSQGELAILLTPPGVVYDDAGTLARVPLAGGEPRPVLEDVVAADWSPDGRDLAVLRLMKGACQLEYPIGHVLARQLPADLLPYLRVSPDSHRVLLTSYFYARVFDRDGKLPVSGDRDSRPARPGRVTMTSGSPEEPSSWHRARSGR